MTHQNTLARGRVVTFAEWDGAEYIMHSAIVRAVVGSNNEFHTEINLVYSDGTGATNVNNVPNEEQITTPQDHWRWIKQPFFQDSMPFQSTRPTPGTIVWFGQWDAEEQEHAHWLAFVRAVPGNPNDPLPNCQLTYYEPSVGDSTNINQVMAFESGDVTGEHYWADILE